jgi:hypothetical protein
MLKMNSVTDAYNMGSNRTRFGSVKSSKCVGAGKTLRY